MKEIREIMEEMKTYYYGGVISFPNKLFKELESAIDKQEAELKEARTINQNQREIIKEFESTRLTREAEPRGREQLIKEMATALSGREVEIKEAREGKKYLMAEIEMLRENRGDE
ncbi:unnamed protein product [marine sediment metagenome]|uniref:Uncharacterized protein n=1 Tax=marine sediment metagenome TaxID=412755 RepID=X0TLI5_9ZZZZ